MEDFHRQYDELEAEVHRLQGKAEEGQKQIRSLEMKLKNARHLLDVEKSRRISAENEKVDLVSSHIAYLT